MKSAQTKERGNIGYLEKGGSIMNAGENAPRELSREALGLTELQWEAFQLTLQLSKEQLAKVMKELGKEWPLRD